MSSILNNASANTALLSLQMTQKAMATTQNQISTGLKVEKAADNAAYWSIAQTMKSDSGVLSAITSSLSVSSSLIDTNTSALNAAIDVVNKMQTALSTAQGANPQDLATIGETIAGYQKTLQTIVSSNSTNGQNLLEGNSASQAVSSAAKAAADMKVVTDANTKAGVDSSLTDAAKVDFDNYVDALAKSIQNASVPTDSGTLTTALEKLTKSDDSGSADKVEASDTTAPAAATAAQYQTAAQSAALAKAFGDSTAASANAASTLAAVNSANAVIDADKIAAADSAMKKLVADYEAVMKQGYAALASDGSTTGSAADKALVNDLAKYTTAAGGAIKAVADANGATVAQYTAAAKAQAIKNLSSAAGAYDNGGKLDIVTGYTSSSGVSSVSLKTADTVLIDKSASGASNVGILTKQGTSSDQASVMTMTVTSSTSKADLVSMLADVDTALKSMRSAATALGAATNEITTQKDFLTTMQKNLQNGVSSLVDADMNEVSTRLQALQTQQQLGVQSLSIANQSTQMILKLFQ